MKRKWLVVLLVVCAVPLILIAGAVIYLANVDWRALAEREASRSLERPVKVGALSVQLGDSLAAPITLDLKDVHIANPSWAVPADMLTVDHVLARVEPGPLFHGTLRYRSLDIEKLVLVLERNKDGVGNWKFGAEARPGAHSEASSDRGISFGPALIPKNRSQVPTMLDFTIKQSEIRYRTSSEHWLTIDFDNLALHTTGDDQPITVTGDGSYNKIPAHLQVGGDSFDKLRQSATPFDASFALTNAVNAVNFRGAMQDPLNFEGVKGAMTIESKRLGEFLKIFDVDTPVDIPLLLAGDFAHSGDHWSLDHAKGSLADNAFTGAIALDEGPRGGTDHMALNLAFDRLLLDSVVDHIGSKSSSFDPNRSAISLPGSKSPEFKTAIAAQLLQFHKLQLADVDVAGVIGPGRIAVDHLRFGFAGSTLAAGGTATAAGNATALDLSAALLGANITDLLKTFGVSTSDIAGKIDARATLAGTGATLNQLLAAGHGAAVLAMREGKVSRDVLEKASTDLRTIFRKGKGMSPVDCLLGVATIQNGIATIAPLTLKSPDAELQGAGTVDLRKRSLDLTIRSNPKSTGFFALDIPIHVSGPLANISAGPAAKSAPLADPPAPNLPPEMRQLAASSGCSQ